MFKIACKVLIKESSKRITLSIEDKVNAIILIITGTSYAIMYKQTLQNRMIDSVRHQ